VAEERLVYSIDTSAIDKAIAQWKELEAVQERVARVTGGGAPGASSGGTGTGAIGSPIGGGPPITAATAGVPRLAGGAPTGALRQQFESLIEGRLAGLTGTIDDAERSVVQSLARQIAGSRLRRSPSDAGLDLLIQRDEAISGTRAVRSADAALERASTRAQGIDQTAARNLRLGAGAAETAADIDLAGGQAQAARRGVRGESQLAGRAFDDALRASTAVQRATERLEQIERGGQQRVEAGRAGDLIRADAGQGADERRARRRAAADELRDFDQQVRRGEQEGRLTEGRTTAADLSLPLRTRFEGISQARQAAGALNLPITERAALAQQRTELSADLREEGRLGRLDPVSRGLAGAGFERFNNAAFQTGIAALTVQFGLLPLFGFNRAAQQQGQEFFGRTPEQAAATTERDIALARVGRQGAPVQAAIERGQAAALQGVERFGLGGAIAGASAAGEFSAAVLNLVSPIVGLAAAISLNTAAVQLNTASNGAGAGAGVAAAGAGAGGAGALLGGAGLAGGLAVAGLTVGAGLGLSAVTAGALAIQGGGRINPALLNEVASRPRESFDPRLPADLQGAGRFEEAPQTGPTFADVVGGIGTALTAAGRGIGRTFTRGFGATAPERGDLPTRTEESFAEVPLRPDQIVEGRARSAVRDLEADPDIQRRVQERRIQENIQRLDPDRAAAQREQLDAAQQRQGLAQARFGVAVAETQQVIGARRFDEDQAEERRQLGVGFGRQVRDIGIQRERTLERIGINRERQQEDIDRGAGRQVEDIGRNLGRQVREIGIGAADSRQDVQRNLGRSLRDIDVQSGQAEEDINLGANRNTRDIFLGQIGGIGGALIRNAVGRQDALADLRRNRERARARAGVGAADAGEDIDIGEGRALGRAGRGAADATQDVGIGQGRATADADTGAGRAIADADRAFGQAISDAARNFGDAAEDLSRAQRTARERFEEDQRLQAILLDRQKAAIEQQTRLIENGTTNISGWLTIVTDFTKAMAEAERVIAGFPGAARRALQEGAAT
jgi:hypothetical protein